MARVPVWRRVAATACDYGLVAGWAGGLLLVATAGPVQPSAARPAVGQLIGAATLTVPATLALAVAERHGGTPGKRLLGLQVRQDDGEALGLPRALARTALRVALPWELAHAGVWRSVGGSADATTAVLVAAAYLLPGAALAGLLRGHRTWYDAVVGADVGPRAATDKPAGPPG